MKVKFGPYSPSRLETANCRYRFKKDYIDYERTGKTREESEIQARGAAVHEVLERMTNYFKTNSQHSFSPQEIQTFITEAIKNHPSAYSQTDSILRCAEMYIKRPPVVLTDDASTELRLAIKKTEDGYEECDYLDSEAFARGRADIMMISDDTTTALVYDHKTQMNIETADTFQMGFYAWVISKIYPFLREIHVVLHFAQYGYYSKPIKYLVKWNEEQISQLPEEERNQYKSLERIEEEILTRIAVIEDTEEWLPIPNNHCQYCPYVMECPILLESFGVGSKNEIIPSSLPTLVTDSESARKAACAIHVIDNYMSHLKKQLKAYTAQNPPILLGDVFYGHKPSYGYDWDYLNKRGRTEILKVFEKYNVDPKDWMVFSSTGSKNLLKHKNSEFLRAVKDILPEKTSTSFGGFKA